MKTAIAICGVAIFFAIQSRASIIAGPITNPANGHDYYLLTPNTWTAAEVEAENLGGTLAVIKNADQQKWVFSTFENYDGRNRGGLWIGLRRTRLGGPFSWVTDEKLNYLNWLQGQPDNTGGYELCAHMEGDSGMWNDLTENSVLSSVVETASKTGEKSLSKQERNLIGDWYEGGKFEQPCWIAGTDDALFVISNNRLASRLSVSDDGSLFVPPNFQNRFPITASGFDGFVPQNLNSEMGMHGEIVKDKILWSNGTWWSRKPVDYSSRNKPEIQKSLQIDTTKAR
jgi:hypothetical protein